MTDLANDATLNLANGASGTTPDVSDTSMDLNDASSGATTSAEQTRAQQVAADTARKLEDRAYQARDWALTQSDTVRTTVLDKPFVSVGTAFAAGIIFGMLLRR